MDIPPPEEIDDQIKYTKRLIKALRNAGWKKSLKQHKRDVKVVKEAQR